MSGVTGSQCLALWVLLWVQGGCRGFIFGHNNKTAAPSTSTSTTSAPTTSTITDTLKDNEWEHNPVKAEAGTIAGLVFGILVCLGLVVTISIMYRRKRRRDAEYRRKLHIRQTSAESAGVYMETTSNQNIYKPTNRGGSNKYTSMRKDRKDPNIYESESEDELWTK